LSKPALFVIDMQRSYLDPNSDSNKIDLDEYPNCKDYILSRANELVIPNIRNLLRFFRERALPVFFFRIAGKLADRSDLHINFRKAYERGLKKGYQGICPLASDPMSFVIHELKPEARDYEITKTTYSPFTRTDLEKRLSKESIDTLILSGLITSQCVNTTARDASDLGYFVYQIEDALTDYDDDFHEKALEISTGAVGGEVTTTEKLLTLLSDRASAASSPTP